MNIYEDIMASLDEKIAESQYKDALIEAITQAANAALDLGMVVGEDAEHDVIAICADDYSRFLAKAIHLVDQDAVIVQKGDRK